MIDYAKEIPAQKLPRPTLTVAKLGVAFEKKFIRALRDSAPKTVTITANPWFEYSIDGETRICSPDFVICDPEFGYGIVGEIKLNWTPLARQKLTELYCPVLSKCSLNIPYKPLVVCKTLHPSSPRPQPRLTWAFNAKDPLFHWPGLGTVLW